jgi:hypothetical protein
VFLKRIEKKNVVSLVAVSKTPTKRGIPPVPLTLNACPTEKGVLAPLIMLDPNIV